MKMLKYLVQAITPVACGALALSLLAGDAMATKKPPVSLFWPNGAKLVVEYTPFMPYPGGTSFPVLRVYWPIANDADHYRLTVVQKGNQLSPVVYDQSPVSYTIGSDGLAQLWTFINLLPGRTYLVILTAYTGPDEAVAYSESLQASIKSP